MSDTRKTTKPNVPNLRFPGFEGEWDKLKVRDFTRVVAGATPATDKKEYWGGVIRWMNSGELNLKRVYEVQGRITQLGYDKTSTKIIPPHSVLIGLAGQGKTRGTAAMNYVELCTNQSIASILPSDSFYSEFLYQNVESRYKELRDISSGDGGRGGLNLQMIYNLYIPHCSMQEQKKIGDFLYLLDQRIAIQNKVIEKYESLIKALYKQLIPGDRDDHAALGTLVRICKGKQLNGEFLSEDGKYYVMNGGITPSGYYDDYNTPAGTISISEGGNSCGFVQYNEKPFWSGGHCYTLLQTTDERVQYKFLYHLLKSKQDDIMALRIGSGLPNIQKKDIGRFPIPMLPLEHQKAITRLLDSVYKHIEYEQALLAELVHLKSYFLGALFI